MRGQSFSSGTATLHFAIARLDGRVAVVQILAVLAVAGEIEGVVPGHAIPRPGEPLLGGWLWRCWGWLLGPTIFLMQRIQISAFLVDVGNRLLALAHDESVAVRPGFLQVQQGLAFALPLGGSPEVVRRMCNRLGSPCAYLLILLRGFGIPWSPLGQTVQSEFDPMPAL